MTVTTPPPATLSTCGTDNGYRTHLRRGQVACEPCKAGHREAGRAWRYGPDRPRRVLQPCGTAAAYNRHRNRREVPCRPCMDAHARDERGRAAARRGSTMRQLVPAGPVRDHVQQLRRAGLGARRIADLADISYGVVSRLLWGDRTRGRAPSKSMFAAHAKAILAVEATVETLGSRIDVDATGTHRRLQALMVLGWTQVRLARQPELDVAQQRINQLLQQDRVGAANAIAVRRLYDRLWETPPPCRDARERDGADRTRARALAAGWAPAMAWDDDTIDDPAASPDYGTDAPAPGRRRRDAVDPDELAWLAAGGVSVDEMARRHKIQPGSVEQALRRAGRHNAAGQQRAAS